MYVKRKTRTQLYLESDQKRVLEQYSQAMGKSVGQLVREAVSEMYLKSQPLERVLSKDDPIWRFVGSGRSKETDVARRHDKYLYGGKKA